MRLVLIDEFHRLNPRTTTGETTDPSTADGTTQPRTRTTQVLTCVTHY
ncbi:hypothetical protein [Streptomyces sp. CLV115]